VEQAKSGAERKDPVRLSRNLRVVPVIDLDGKQLYEVDRQTACQFLSEGRADNHGGHAIRMRASREIKSATNANARSVECWPENLGYYRKMTPANGW
jgi:hypothetical protein